MRKGSQFKILLLLVLFNISGCKSIGEIKDIIHTKVDETIGKISDKKTTTSQHDIKKTNQKLVKSSSSTSQAVAKGFEGTWVAQITCSKREGIKSNVEYSLLEISKNKGSNYLADFFIFEEREGSIGLTLNRSQGSLLKMEGRSKKGNTEIELTGKEWLLKSNRHNPIGIKATIKEDGFLLKGSISGDSSCSSFVATKVPVNNLSERNSVFPLNDILKKYTSRRGAWKKTDSKQCIEFINWVSSGNLVEITEITKISRQFKLSSLLFDDENFVRHLGKTYKNWTSDDSMAFAILTTRCESNHHQSHALEHHQTYKKYTSLKMTLLNEAKDHENKSTSLIKPNSKSIFDIFLKTKQPLNIRWAGNYFILAAVKSAKLYEELILQKLQNLDSSDKSTDEINTYLQHKEFPLNFQLASNKNLFNVKVLNMYNDRKGANAEQRLIAFNTAQYPKTLQGYKTLLRDSNGIKQAIQSLHNSSKRADLNKRYEAMIEGHSLAAGQNIVASIPKVNVDPTGFGQLDQYIRMMKKDEIVGLQINHQSEFSGKLDSALSAFFTNFFKVFDLWVDEHVTDGKEGIAQLNTVSKQLFKRNLFDLSKEDSPSMDKRQVAGKILQEVDKRQDDCDQLASHPSDKHKPSFIRGVSDIRLNVDQAVDACISSVESEPDNIRLNFQLGRALYLGQLYDDAFSFLSEASNNGYAPARFYLADFYVRGLGPVEPNIEKSEQLYKLSANNNFSPASAVISQFEAELQRDRKKIQQEKDEELRIAKAKFKVAFIMDPLLTGEYENINHGLGMAYVIEVTAHLVKTCQSGVSNDELNAMRKLIFEKNAEGFISMVKKSAPTNPLMRLLYDRNSLSGEKTGPDVDVEVFNLNVLQDMALFLQKYGCSGDMYDKFMTNAKKFLLSSDVPPYNLTSESFWNICMNQSGSMRATKERFCSCFLYKVRTEDVQRKTAKDLYNNFWPTAYEMITNPKNDSFNLNRCLNPPKRSQ
jgi:hypothetical protein